jgi:3-phenylpropionate/cinnamic acid dioxygenase small subunit
MNSNGDYTLEYLKLVRSVEDFLAAEADLLDEWKYNEWLDLLTDDVRYWMPLHRNAQFGERERERSKELQDLAWMDEGKTILALRVKQLMTGIHWAEEPLSRMTHMVSNIHVTDIRPSVEDVEEVEVKSRFLVYRNRLQIETDFFIGKREDTLRRVNGAWKICRRNIFLDQNVLMAKNLTFLF